MAIVYVAALVLGLGTIFVQLFGSSDAEGGHDVDHGGGHHDGEGVHAGGALAAFLSLRFWTFLLMAFGLVGTLLSVLGLAGPVVTVACATAMGLFSGAAASLTFRALARSAVTGGSDSGDAVGQIGRVLVPPAKSGFGKIRIELNGQMVDYLATSDEPELEQDAEVLVVEMRGEGVHVARAGWARRGD